MVGELHIWTWYTSILISFDMAFTVDFRFFLAVKPSLGVQWQYPVSNPRVILPTLIISLYTACFCAVNFPSY